MGFLVGILCFLMACIGVKVFQNVLNHVTLFNGYWSILCSLSACGFYQIHKTSNDAYGIILIGNLCFMIFGIVKYRDSGAEKYKEYNEIDMKKLWPIFIFNTFFSYILFSRTKALIKVGYSMAQIRAVYANNPRIILTSRIEEVLYQYVYCVNAYILMIVGVWSFCKKKFTVFAAASFLVIMRVLDGGRLIVLYYIIILVFTFSYVFAKTDQFQLHKNQKFLKKMLYIVSIFLVALIIIISKLRTDNFSFFKELYIYFCGSLPLLSHHLNRIQQGRVFTFGYDFVSGIMAPVLFVLKQMKIISDYPKIFYDFVKLSNCEKNIMLGPGIYGNSFVTLFFDFYLDGGIAGVCILSGAFGMISSKFYCAMKSTNCYKYILNFGFILIAILTSMMRWQFKRPYIVLAMLFSLTMWRKEEAKNEKKQ